MAKQVMCTDKGLYGDNISGLGGIDAGQRWKRTEQQAVLEIESRTESYFVERPGYPRVNVVVSSRNGVKYLKTEADGEKPNNLLSLPNCP